MLLTSVTSLCAELIVSSLKLYIYSTYLRCISSHLSLSQNLSVSEFPKILNYSFRTEGKRIWFCKTKVGVEVTEADEAHRNMWCVTEQNL